MAEWFNDPGYVALAEELFAGCPDSWDGDEAQEAILIRYVHHLRDEVVCIGGCLLPHCRWDDDEPCDHGYLAIEDALGDHDDLMAALRRLRWVVPGRHYSDQFVDDVRMVLRHLGVDPHVL